MQHTPSVNEMEAAVTASPAEHALRRDLIDALLGEGELQKASDHFAVLLEQLPNELWVLEFGVEVMTITGDSLQIARLRRRLREIEENDDNEVASPHPGHPSQDNLRRRHLSVVAAAGDERRDGIGFHTTARLDDIAGLETVKANLSSLVEGVRTPAPTAAGWPGSMLFYGPPSCGKAFCGEVAAGELGSLFWYVDLEDQWSAEAIVEVADAAASQGSSEVPSVLYLDNVDCASVAVEQLVQTLDRVAEVGSVITLVAATHPWSVDDSLTEGGRISRALLVLPPDPPARRLFLQRRIAQRASIGEDDLQWVVDRTDGHSFGDLESLVDLAFLLDESGGPVLGRAALATAMERISPSSSEWLETARAKASTSGDERYGDLFAYFDARQNG